MWGKIISLAHEKRLFGLHALCGDLSEFELKDKELYAYTEKSGFLNNFMNLEYDKVMQDLINELKFDIKVKVVQKVRQKTREEIIKERLIQVFGEKMIFE